MTPKTAMCAETSYRYMRTWRIWRLCWQHERMYLTRMQQTTSETELQQAQQQAFKWNRTGNRLWEQRQKLKEQLIAAGLTMTPD